MLMVIFGAGASYDSAAALPIVGSRVVREYRPPLAAQLFDDRFGDEIRQFPHCRPLFPRLRRAAAQAGAPIEQELERISEEAEHQPRFATQLLALRAYIAGAITWSCQNWSRETNLVTNYHDLLHEVARPQHLGTKELAIVTFNYDTLLEDAIHGQYHFRLSHPGSYVGHPDLKLFKVHGSTSWWREVVSADGSKFESEDAILDSAQSLRLTDSYTGASGASRINAIAVPTRISQIRLK